MVEFDLASLRARVPGGLPNRLCRDAARFGSRRTRDGAAVIRRPVDAPYRIRIEAARDPRGWRGVIKVGLYEAEVEYPAVRHLAPEKRIVTPDSEPTYFSQHEKALSLAISLMQTMLDQLQKEVFG